MNKSMYDRWFDATMIVGSVGLGLALPFIGLLVYLNTCRPWYPEGWWEVCYMGIAAGLATFVAAIACSPDEKDGSS